MPIHMEPADDEVAEIDAQIAELQARKEKALRARAMPLRKVVVDSLTQLKEVDMLPPETIEFFSVKGKFDPMVRLKLARGKVAK